MPRNLSAILILSILLVMTVVSPALAAPALDDGSHIVQPGETLSGIAQRYGVSVQALMQANGIANASLIRSGQRLVIPGNSAGTQSSATVAPGVHVVKSGETLSGIAARYGVSMQAVAQANGISNPSLIRSGQRLTIPGGGSALAAPSTGAAPAAAPASASGVYVVKAGDTLAAIARRHGTSVSAIANANRINNPSQIRVGQRLTIPSGTAPVVQSGGGLSVQVSISQQRCWVYRNGQLLYAWRCSTGRSGAGTKTGTFYVQSKIREAWGSRWGFYMPYWLGIYWAGSTENGIHGLPYTPGGSPIWANALGTPVTFGCVLLGAEESKTLWEMAYVGMPVTISY
jgi:LysM repeat protein